MSQMDYTKAKDWIIREKEFHAKFLGKCEAIMCLGNGYMGMRSSTEEKYTAEKRDLLIAGTFNKFDENEVTELPNGADVAAMDIMIDGEEFSLNSGTVKSYERELNIKTGELCRKVLWVSPKGAEVEFQFKRFISMKQLHVIGQKVVIKPIGSDIFVKILTGINGRMTNNGSQHFSEGDKRLYDKTYMQYTQTTSQSNITFVFTSGVKLMDEREGEAGFHSRIIMERRTIETEFQGTVKKGEALVIEKLTDVRTTRDRENEGKPLKEICEESLLSAKELYKAGYESLVRESAKAWEEKVWNKVPVKIDSEDELDQLAIRFAQYHLYVMTPAHDNRMNIGAKGLSGEGYKGHTFWDTDIFALPYFTFTDPDIAKKLVEYRYLSLPGAHEKAKENGFLGAQFPWESAWLDDGEVTPVWGAADIFTGLPTKIWSGFIEQHITSDVVYGIWQYYMVTGDEEFMERCGYEVIMDTAKFWITRLEPGDDGQYHINDVVGPDEYKERVNDNAFTNYMAHWNVEKAVEYHNELKKNKPALFERLNEKLELDQIYPLWMERKDAIYLPKPREEDHLIAQDAEYLSLKQVDLTKYKNQKQVGSMFLDYNLEQVNKIQVSKQADIMILFLLMEDLFSLEVKQANWDYYEPRTLHDSSLSLSTHCILANDMGQEEMAYELFQRARAIDMGENMKSSDEGIHAASLAGIWQSSVFGFGGVRMLNGTLRINPALPKKWSKLEFILNWQGQRLRICVTKGSFSIVNETGTKVISFEHGTKIYQLDKKIEIIFE